MAPQVTLLIPSRSEPQLRQTIAALQQGLHDLPVVIHVEPDPSGMGVGWALREGFRRIDTPWVIFVMADGSEDPTCLRRMILRCLADPPVQAVWGTRWSGGGSVEGYPRIKYWLNRWGNWLLQQWLDDPYDDWTDLAKAYRMDLLREVRWDDDFRCAVQIPIRYLLHTTPRFWDRRVIPMHWTERTAGRSAYRLRHVWGCLVAAWKETHR